MPWQREIFHCPHCGQQFDWKPELASRKFGCRCGNTFSIPGPAEPDEEVTYDFKPANVEPVETTPIASPSVPRGQTLGYERVGSRTPERLKPDDDLSVRNLWVPGTMIFFGFFATTIRLGWTNANFQFSAQLLAELLYYCSWEIGVTLISLFIAARVVDVGFGEPMRAVFKVAAIAMGPLGILSMVITLDASPNGFFIGFVASIFVYFWLFGYLFELEFGETGVCVLIATICRLIAWVAWRTFF